MKSNARFLLFLVLFLVSSRAGAQEFAVDFTRTDCKGADHQFFSELDAGKVILLDFVMLGCTPCLKATQDIDTIVNSFASTHPDRVKIYSFSYDSAHTCEQMSEWRNDGGFPNVTLFIQGTELVNYYGGIGMPTIVVTGSSLHKVFYNGYGYSPDNDSLIIAAINNALNYNQSAVDEEIAQTGFRAYPTLFSDRIYVETGMEFSGAEVIIFDSYGRQVLSSAVTSKGPLSLPATGLSRGIYFARLKGGDISSGSIRLIKR